MRPLARALPAAGPALLGLLIGLAWWLLAPTGPVVLLQGGSVLSQVDPEQSAAQDGVLVLLGAVAGLLCGLGGAARPGESPTRRSLLVVAGCLLGSALAAAVGGLLGPPSVASQLAAGATPAEGLVSPLMAHSTGVLLVWPAVAALVMCAGHLAAAWTGSSRARAEADADDAAGVAGADEA